MQKFLRDLRTVCHNYLISQVQRVQLKQRDLMCGKCKRGECVFASGNDISRQCAVDSAAGNSCN